MDEERSMLPDESADIEWHALFPFPVTLPNLRFWNMGANVHTQQTEQERVLLVHHQIQRNSECYLRAASLHFMRDWHQDESEEKKIERIQRASDETGIECVALIVV